MDLNLSSDLIQSLIIFMIVGLISLFYNKPIANELAKVFLIPTKLMFGERHWFQPVSSFVVFGLRLALYGGAFIAAIAVLLTLISILSF